MNTAANNTADDQDRREEEIVLAWRARMAADSAARTARWTPVDPGTKLPASPLSDAEIARKVDLLWEAEEVARRAERVAS